jgi:hypothetical protein
VVGFFLVRLLLPGAFRDDEGDDEDLDFDTFERPPEEVCLRVGIGELL